MKSYLSQFFSSIFTKASKILDKPHFNQSLCLIFNGFASIISIVFIVLFIMGQKNLLLLMGFVGMLFLFLANLTDTISFWLMQISKKLTSEYK